MYCGKCGRQLEDNYVFCPSCGNRIIKTPEGQVTTAYNYDFKKPIRNKQTNVYAVLSLVLSFTLAGIVMGGLGISKSAKLNGSGKVLSIIGIVLSVILNVVVIWSFVMTIQDLFYDPGVPSDAVNELCLLFRK